jgi:hypothetical protein
MRSGVHRTQALLTHMSVDLRGLQTRMSEQFLHHPQISAAIEEVGGEAVPQCVRMGRHGRTSIYDAPHITRSEAVATLIIEERTPWGDGRGHRSTMARQPRMHRCYAGGVNQYLALLRPFAGNRDYAFGELKIVNVEAAQLGHPHAAPVEHFEHCVVPHVPRERSGSASSRCVIPIIDVLTLVNRGHGGRLE